MTLAKEQNKTREPLTESQTRAYTLSLSHTHTQSPIHENKKLQGTWACHTNTQAHTLRYVHTLSQTHAYTHTFTTNKESPKSSAYTRTHTQTYRRPDDCTSSFTSQPKPKNLSPIIWPVLGATGNPELPLSSGGDAGISAISPSLENKSLLVLPPSPCFQGSWG